MKMRRLFLYLFAIFVLAFLDWWSADGSKFILLSSTIGPIDSGIVDVLENAFEKERGIRVRHVGAGTGLALDIARKGNVDLVMVHAKSLEEKFVQEGYGTHRIALMYNDFVIVGPEADPAGIKGLKRLRKRFTDSEKSAPLSAAETNRDPRG
jgi:tungstate transport system substrate-binding protein